MRTAGAGRALLLTRPRVDSASLAAALATRGWMSLIDPMLDIVYEAPPLPDLAPVDALVFTSRYGVQGFTQLSAMRHLPVYAVGSATAAAARHAGFTQIVTGPGDAAGLAGALGSGRFLHPGGAEIRQALGTQLTVYRARASRRLSGETLAALKAGRIEAVLFFSPRSARIFVDLATGLERAAWQDVWALCLSRAVLESASELPWRGTQVAAAPNRQAMLTLLDGLQETGWSARSDG